MADEARHPRWRDRAALGTRALVVAAALAVPWVWFSRGGDDGCEPPGQGVPVVEMVETIEPLPGGGLTREVEVTIACPMEPDIVATVVEKLADAGDDLDGGDVDERVPGTERSVETTVPAATTTAPG